MQRKTLIAILCGLLALLLCLGTVLVVYTFTQKEDNSEIYQQKLDTGKKYLESGDYEQAIAAYRAAIEADPTNDEAYYQLAIMYRDLNRMQEMKSVLEEGIAKTSSDRLSQLYEFYFGELTGNNQSNNVNTDSNKDKVPENGGININYSYCSVIANYTFAEYTANFRNADLKKDGEIYKYTFTDFPGTVYFFNSENGESIIYGNDIPYDTVRANYVTMGDLSIMFNGIEEGHRIKATEIPDLGAVVLKSQAYDATLGNYVQFVYNNCIFDVAVDDANSFGMDSAHRLYSKFGTGSGNVIKVFEYEVTIIDATTGRGVPDATVEISMMGNVEFTGTTDNRGVIKFELPAGIYEIVVSCDGYITTGLNRFVLYNTGVCEIDTITISPELDDGELRIVLEWGDYPSDLDSYLVDDMGRVQINYQKKNWVENGDTVAELDIDDTTGYGPETITVYDLSKDFTYYVHDYSNTGEMFSRTDVTVKVYTSNSAPTIYTIDPSQSDARGWCVFSYIDGQLKIQDKEVPNLGDFRHYN